MDFANTAESIRNSFQPFYQDVEIEGDIEINAVYDLRAKIQQRTLYTLDQVEQFIDVMTKNSGKKQTPAAVGKLVSILKPALDAYKEIEPIEERLAARQEMLKFVRYYGYVTNICRIDDKELFKEYLFVSYLIHLLPKTQDEKITVNDKIQLEYFRLEERFNGAIELEKKDTTFVPASPKKPAALLKKKDTFERIIEKVNLEHQGDFESGDRVALENVYQMMMGDSIVKTRLSEFAKTNDINMFIKSIFPGEFQRILVQCYTQNYEAFQRLMGDEAFQKLVMDTMAAEFYRALKKPEGE